MFTPLNLGFDGSLQPDQRLFPADGAVSGGSRRTTSFAASLDTSLKAQAGSGDTLPLDGGTLPPVLDLSLQVAAIEERVSAVPLAGALEFEQSIAPQPVSPDAAGGVALDGDGGSEALAAALEFMTGISRRPETGVAVDAGPGRLPPDESAPAGHLTTAKSEVSILPQSTPVIPGATPRPADAGERRSDATRAPTTPSGVTTHPGMVATPAAATLAENDPAPDPRLAELRLSQQSSGAPDPVIRPPVGTGPAADLPVELPVHRPAATALPESAATVESASATAVSLSSAEGPQKASPRPAALPAISTPVGQSDWGDSLSERVLVMTSGKLGNAEIRLTPAELGPVRVQVSVDDGTATVSFQASHATTREAIEQALPRLRDMLTENGLSLGQASVGDQGVHDGSREATDDPTASDDAFVEAGDESVAELPVEVEVRRVSSALVDTFA